MTLTVVGSAIHHESMLVSAVQLYARTHTISTMHESTVRLSCRACGLLQYRVCVSCYIDHTVSAWSQRIEQSSRTRIQRLSISVYSVS